MNAFKKIHNAGVFHGDVAERNVLVNEEGRVSVIDFEEGLELECERTVAVPGLGDLAPREAELRCPELWDLGWRMRLWKPCKHAFFSYNGSTVLTLVFIDGLHLYNSDDRPLWNKIRHRGL